jgi:acyl-CoA hydrolase
MKMVTLFLFNSPKILFYKVLDDIEFLKPIHIGDLVRLDLEIIKIGETSLRIKIDESSTHLIKNKSKKNCECYILFVVVDKKGNKTFID